MKKFIPAAYAQYGREIDSKRAIPHYKDALKPVERRLLLSLFDEARKKFTSSSRIIGHCMGHYHHHGDASVYDSLAQLVRRNFAFGQGNWGQKGLKDRSQAAMRYTEVKTNPELSNLCFELVDFVPWDDIEQLGINQPFFLPSPVPIGLIGESIIHGIGFS